MPYKAKEIAGKGKKFSDKDPEGAYAARTKAAESMIQTLGEEQAATDKGGLILGILPLIGKAVGGYFGGPAGAQIGGAIGEGLANVGMAAEDRPERLEKYKQQKEAGKTLTSLGKMGDSAAKGLSDYASAGVEGLG